LCEERKMSEDYFQEVEEKVEQEAKGIRGRRKEIEQEALRVIDYFSMDLGDATRAKLTAERLINASVWASQQGNDITAIAALRVATELDVSSWKACYNLGWHYLTIGKKLHEPYMGKVTVSDGASLYKSLATRMSFYKAAAAYFEKAIDLNPKGSKIWCALGQTQYYSHEYDLARASLQKAIDLDPDGEGGRMASDSLAILENTSKYK
jgi:tetratricopeptide (TPR) repeat protein